MSPTQYDRLNQRLEDNQKGIDEILSSFKNFNDVIMPAMVETLKDIHKQFPCRQAQKIKNLEAENAELLQRVEKLEKLSKK